MQVGTHYKQPTPSLGSIGVFPRGSLICKTIKLKKMTSKVTFGSVDKVTKGDKVAYFCNVQIGEKITSMYVSSTPDKLTEGWRERARIADSQYTDSQYIDIADAVETTTL